MHGMRIVLIKKTEPYPITTVYARNQTSRGLSLMTCIQIVAAFRQLHDLTHFSLHAYAHFDGLILLFFLVCRMFLLPMQFADSFLP